MDIGKRIERGLALTALLRATLTTVRSPGAEQTVTESTLVACESSVIYRRRNPGAVSIAAVADLVLLDAENPRSLVYQFERLRADLKALPGSSGSSRPERLVDEIGTRLRRLDPADLEDVAADGRRGELADLLDRDAQRPARPVRRHHRDAPVAARRHAAAVGSRRTPGDAMTGGTAIPGDSQHGLRVLRRRDEFLRPRLPHAARHRSAALPFARTADRPRTGRQFHQQGRLRKRELVLPCHRAAPQAVGHQRVGRRGGPAAGRALRRRIRAGAMGDRAAGRPRRRAGDRVHSRPAAAGDHRRACGTMPHRASRRGGR